MSSRRLMAMLALALPVALLVLAPSLVRHEATPRVSGAERALRLWTAQRAYPNPSLPARGYTDAFAYTQAHLAEDPAKAAEKGPWIALGPHNIGGRTLAVALNPQNPNTVYAGSASGGLWRSYTGGVGALAWEYVATGFPILGVSCIAIAPGDSNIMYIGTGEVYSYYDTEGGIAVRYTRGSYGMGILKTADGGETWSRSLDWSYQQQRGIWAIKINPSNPNTVWAGTTEGTYKSIDAGESWFQVDDTIMVNDLVIDPGDTNRVMIACGNFESPGHGLYRTIDNGDTWQQLFGTALPATWAGKAQLATCPVEPGVVYASIGNGDVGSNWTKLLRTLDFGDTWILRSASDYAQWQGWFAHDVGVDPTNANRVIAIGIDIWRSSTGGTSLVQKSDWTLWYFGQTEPGGPEGPPTYSHADHHDIAFHPTDPDIVYFANDGGVFRTLDFAATFEGCNGGYQTQQFYAGFTSSNLDPDLAIGGMQDNSTAIYQGNLGWYRAIGGDGSWTAIDPDDPEILYGSAQYLYLFKSYNGGVDWEDIAPPASRIGAPGFIAPYALGGDTPTGRKIFAAGTKVAVSFDGGNTWNSTNGGQELDGNPALTVVTSPLDDNVVYVTTAPVATRAGVFRADNGYTFVDITGDLPDRYPVGLAIDPTDDRIVYVALSGFGTSHVFKSVDGGGNWQDIGAGLPDVPTSAVIVDPDEPSHVYVGNDIGVFYTTNAGAEWHAYNHGLPDAVVAMDLTISPVDRMLRVSTYGNGVYERGLVADAVGVEEHLPVVTLRLEQNHPNPFNPATTIRYRLVSDVPVRLAVFDAAGHRVRTLVDERQTAGEHSVVWAGLDDGGRRVASGVYMYELRAGHEVRSRKMTLLQ